MAGSSVGPIWLHHPMAAGKDQLQAERPLELAAHWDLCSQYAGMSGGLHFGGEPLYHVHQEITAVMPDWQGCIIEGRGRLT